MKSQKDIRIRIAQIKQENSHLLEGSPASVEVNAPRAIFQVRTIALLDSLYWVLGENFQHKWPKKLNQ
jgi:hypothetical protein